MIFQDKVLKNGDIIDKFAIIEIIIGHGKNAMTFFMQRYQLRILSSAHGEVFVDGKSIGYSYWDH